MKIIENAICSKNSMCHFMHNIFFRFRFFNLAQTMPGGQWPRNLDGGWSQWLTQAKGSVARIHGFKAQDSGPDADFAFCCCENLAKRL